MNAVKIGMIGLGTVGGGVLAVLQRNAEEITRRAGREMQVLVAVVRDKNKARDLPLAIPLTTDLAEVVQHPQVEIVIELAGGGDEIYEAVMTALDHGKHVITANKSLIAQHGNEIFAKAQAKGVVVAFEAAVAGGVPIIKSLREGLSANRIQWLAGIINGTSNYILTEMAKGGDGGERDFATVLAEAQRLGFAEADPAFDIDGIDAAHKLTILAAIAFGIALQYQAVSIEGITDITSADIRYADELGYTIKHLGLAKRVSRADGDAVELRVHPTLIPKSCLLANVDGVMNAVLVQGDAVGSTLYYGAGAGAEPTASAVVADLVDVVRTITTDAENRVPHLAFQPDALVDLPLLACEEVETAYYLRLMVINRPGVIAAVATIFADSGISIASILQKGGDQPDADVTIIMVTQNTVEGNLVRAVRAVEQLNTVRGKVMRVRLEHLA